MKKQTLTKKQQKALLDIAKRLMVAVESRGDLEARGCDSEDFIKVPVWGIQKAMEEAYLLGRRRSKPDTAPTKGHRRRPTNSPTKPHKPHTGAVWRGGGATEE